ncbi:MAG: phage portal protein [Desulfurellales bacterium]|nr:MAG: phage portal protein [Desulfurellales bacterium]
MGYIDSIRAWARGFLGIDQEQDKRARQYERLDDYFKGNQRKPLRVKPGQADDNTLVNFCALVVNRGVSFLLGDDVTFDLPGDDTTAEQELIDATWDANKKDTLLYKAALRAGKFGTGYFKIMPEAVQYKGVLYSRLVSLDPRLMRIVCAPDDMDNVLAYDMRWMEERPDDMGRLREVYVREYTVSQTNGDGDKTWIVQSMTSRDGVRWETVDETPWPYDFPPIIDWQNLPREDMRYGDSDLEDIIPIQDAYNESVSNIRRILRYHAHPKTWARGLGQSNTTSWGADEMVTATGDTAMIANLEMQSDLSSSSAFTLSIRQTLFDIARTVDLSSIADKVGALTNFGLRVLYTDMLSKRNTKRAHFGEALIELNRRLLIIAGYSGDEPGVVVWPETMPQNRLETIQAVQAELAAGVVSKQTATGELGRDWNEESERIKSQPREFGGFLLEQFNQGR